MADFQYQGRDLQGQLQKGLIKAATEQAAAEQLFNKGITPTLIEIASTASKSGDKAKGSLNITLFESVKTDDLVVFCRQMYAMNRAGVPLLRGITSLAEATRSPLLKRTLQDVAHQLTNGRTLSQAMQQHPKIFNRLFVGIVHVGESSGRLDSVFNQLAIYLEQELENKRRIKSATRYPMFVTIAVVLAMVVMNTMVIPKFAAMFQGFGIELPLATRILLATSHAFTEYWAWMLLALIGSWTGIHLWLKTSKGRIRWDRWKLKLPIVGDVIERALLARFSRTFSVMLRAGVPLNQALSLVASTAGNAWVESRVVGMRQDIEGGMSLLKAAERSEMFPPLVKQMIHVGEETGQVDDLLDEVAGFYEREVDYDLKTMTARIEPILIGLVAVMVGILVMGIFTPMWDMVKVARGG